MEHCVRDGVDGKNSRGLLLPLKAKEDQANGTSGL
jgi:hypothetical protein